MGYTVTAWELNQAADKLADDAAETVQLDNYIVKLVQRAGEKAKLVQQRLLAIQWTILTHTKEHPRQKVVR